MGIGAADATSVRPVSRAAALRVSLSRGGTTWMLSGSLLAALGAYLFQVLGARSLGEVAYAPIGVLWTVQYLLTSVLMTALESWVVRTTTSGDGSTGSLRTAAPRLVAAVAAVSGAVFAIAYLAKDLLFPARPALVFVVPLLVVAYSAFATVRGVLAARERYKAYGGVTAAESLSRLAVAGLIAVTVPSATLLALTLPLGAVTAAAWGAVSRLREKKSDPATVERESISAPSPVVEAGGPGRFLGVTSGANAAAQVLLAGAPLAMGPLGASPRDVSVLFVTITAARVPLVIVQGGLLSRLLPTFTRVADAGAVTTLVRTGIKMVSATGALAIIAAVAGWLAGPTLVALLFGNGFRPDQATTAAVAFGMVLATGALLTNQILIASHHENALVPAWWGALAAAAATVALTGTLTATDRVLAGFVVGEVTALLLLTAALSTMTRRHPPAVQNGPRT
jgi:O-antigen/teichoic acid export membrane protein